MTNERKKWHCSSCPHSATRRGNMVLHILRWHGGGEPVYLGDHSEYLLKSKKANHQRPSSIYNTLNSDSFPFPFQNSHTKKSNSLFEPINSVFRNFLEASQIPAKVAAIKSSYSGNVSHHPQLNTNLGSYHITPRYYGKPFVPPFTQAAPISIADTKYPSFVAPPAINSQGNRIEELAGFSARVCENCSEAFVEVKYEVEENGDDPIIVTKNEHICLCTLKGLGADEIRRITNVAADPTRLPWVLNIAVKGWTGHAFLIAFEVPFDKVKTEDIIDIFVSPRDITNYDRNGNDNHPNPKYEEILNGWVLRVIENGSISLNDNDLIDFIMIANNKTWGYFRIHVDVLKVNKDIPNPNSEIYCMFVNNRPILKLDSRL